MLYTWSLCLTAYNCVRRYKNHTYIESSPEVFFFGESLLDVRTQLVSRNPTRAMQCCKAITEWPVNKTPGENPLNMYVFDLASQRGSKQG